MSVLVLGGEGMLGHKMFQVLRERLPGVRCTIRGARRNWAGIDLLTGDDVLEGIDVLREDRLSDLLRRERPAAIVNCIGIIKQRQQAVDPIVCISINALLPHRLAALAAEWGGRVVHFSTDCVFSGKRGRYTESDELDAQDLYGRSKALGEVARDNALTLRTSIIGRELNEHKSLLDWFLLQDGGRVRGFTRVLYSGVTTNHLAGVVADLLGKGPDLHGLFHLASDPISKHDLLVLLREAYGLEVEIEADDREVSDRSLVAERFNAATGHRCPPWRDLVAALAADTTPYASYLRQDDRWRRIEGRRVR